MDLHLLEQEVIIIFGCDFNFMNPINFVDRYLRILNYNKVEQIVNMCYEMCKFSLNHETFLEYRASQIAACSVILSINIYLKEAMQFKCMYDSLETNKKYELST